jgi:FAD synthase
MPSAACWKESATTASSTSASTRPSPIEVHIFHFHGNIYGRILDVHFIERIRDEVRFTSPEELIAQIERDIARAREILQSPKLGRPGMETPG